MDGTFTTIKCHFWGFLNPTPHFIPHLFYLRLMFLRSVRSPLHLKHLKPFGTLATIKPHLAPSLLVLYVVCVVILITYFILSSCRLCNLVVQPLNSLLFQLVLNNWCNKYMVCTIPSMKQFMKQWQWVSSLIICMAFIYMYDTI